MSNSPNLTARTWLSAIFVSVTGIFIFMYVVVSSALSSDQRYFTLDAPGEATFSFRDTGDYYLFHEFQRTPDSQGMLRPPGVGALKVQIVNDAARATVPLTPDTSGRYVIYRTVGESLYAFTIDTPGNYRVTALHPDGSDAPHTLTIGRTQGQQVFVSLRLGFAVLLGTSIFVVLILYFGARRRS